MTTSRGTTPSLDTLISYWREHYTATFVHDYPAYVGWSEPFCFRCGWLVPLKDCYAVTNWQSARGWLERAHLQDVASEGPTVPSNIVPLCQFCHRAMPPCYTREQAITYINDGIRCDGYWQFFTDCRYGDGKTSGYIGWSDLFADHQMVYETVRKMYVR